MNEGIISALHRCLPRAGLERPDKTTLAAAPSEIHTSNGRIPLTKDPKENGTNPCPREGYAPRFRGEKSSSPLQQRLPLPRIVIPNAVRNPSAFWVAQPLLAVLRLPICHHEARSDEDSQSPLRGRASRRQGSESDVMLSGVAAPFLGRLWAARPRSRSISPVFCVGPVAQVVPPIHFLGGRPEAFLALWVAVFMVSAANPPRYTGASIIRNKLLSAGHRFS